MTREEEIRKAARAYAMTKSNETILGLLTTRTLRKHSWKAQSLHLHIQ